MMQQLRSWSIQPRALATSIALGGAVSIGATACRTEEMVTSSEVGPSSEIPVFSISDGDNGGNPHFYFLRPTTSSSTRNGRFDPTRTPSIRVCVWTGGACGATVATFTMGPGPEGISLDPYSEAYRLVWKVPNYNLDPEVTYRLTVYQGQIPLGHADLDVVWWYSCTGTGCGPLPGQVLVYNWRPFVVKFRIEIGWLTQRIAFHSERDGNREIYVMNADGSDQVRLTTSGFVNGEPDWSPDGSRIGFYSWRDAVYPANWTSEIYAMDADGGNQVRLTHDNLLQAEAAWSPDGGSMLMHGYTSEVGEPRGRMGIYQYLFSSGFLHNLSINSTADEGGPDWSFDGSKIVFQSLRDGPWELFVRDANGRHKLASPAPLYDVTPKWSPDGTRIVFVSFRDFNTEIYVADADGSDQERLTFNAADDVDPEWSPDGSGIVFASNRDGDFDLYLMAPDGTSVRQLTNAPGSDRAPEWRRR